MLKELDLSVRPHDGPNVALYWPEMAGGILFYKDLPSVIGSCGVRIFESDDNSRLFLIVLTELKNNTGPSVTNAVEHIVNLLCSRIEAQVASLAMMDVDCTFVFVERYEVRPTEFNWVNFIYEQDKWQSPSWIRANKEETTFLLNLLINPPQGLCNFDT